MRAIDADALLAILKREEQYLRDIGVEERSDGVMDAIMDVIDAPTIEPEPCDDAVSRKEAIGWFEEYKRKSDEMYEAMRLELMKAPSVTPKPKTGKWISGAENFNTNCSHECSQCGALIDMYHGGADDYFFCPICGAKMEV